MECGTTQPVPGATISVHIDDGIHGARSLRQTFVTNDAGMFDVDDNGSETCGADSTLTFEKEGFTPVVAAFKDNEQRAEVCMSRAPVAPP